MLSIRIERDPISLNYLRDKTKPFDWLNNDANNGLDDFILLNNGLILFKTKIQTVSNMEGLDPGIHFYDTITPGPFKLKIGVEQRSFYGRINGICDTHTLRGDYINMDSVTATNSSRWLNHDTQKHRTDAKGNPVPPMTLTRVAWSAGCFVFLEPNDLGLLGAFFDQNGLKSGDIVEGELLMK